MRSLALGVILVGGLHFVGCGSDDPAASPDASGSAAQGGSGGAGGSGQAGGAGGQSGGRGGAAGTSGGHAGTAGGHAGAGGGQGGTGGSAGKGAGGDGTAGTAGSATAGSAGAAGSGGDAAGSGGDAGSAGSGDAGAGGSGGDTGVGGSGGDAGAAGTGGTSGGGGESGGAGGSVAGPKVGYVDLTSFATEVAGFFVNSVSATIFDGPGYSNGKGCTVETTGACRTIVCDYTNGGDIAPDPGAFQSAGAISITGTTPAFSLDFDAGMKAYLPTPTVPNDKLIFAGGDTLTASAAGGDVPAFMGSVVAPSPLVVTSPDLSSLSVDTTKDLVFVWTGSSVGKASFYVSTSTSTTSATISSSNVSCQFDASALTGTIPAALLQKLEKTNGTMTSGNLGAGLGNETLLTVGDHTIHLVAASVMTKPDGKTAYSVGQIKIF